MSKFLNDLDEFSNKVAYQSYTLSHGIERLTILVPLTNAEVFEEEFEAASKTKEALLEVVRRHAGKIRG